MSEHTELPKLAVGYMDQGMGHGHYAVIEEDTEQLFAKVGTGRKDVIEQVVIACNAYKDLLAGCRYSLKFIDSRPVKKMIEGVIAAATPNQPSSP